MRKIFFILLIIAGLSSCENFDIEHPDYEYTSGYFPYQFPVRTLILGDYIYDNSNDNDHKFIISVAMGGVYQNKIDRTFQIEVDESLCDNVLFEANGDPIRALPSSYYTLSDNGKIVIPKGKVNGGIEVNLTEAFFSDPLAIRSTYVVPIRLKGSSDVDTILVGKSTIDNPDVRNASDWIEVPKNFTMFAVKYINEYHGTYFQYGKSSVKDGSNNVVENTTYEKTYIEQNNIVKLVTSGRNQVTLNTNLNSLVMGESVKLLLSFSGNNCTISSDGDSPYTISGSGTFKSKEYNWGNKERDGIELNFSVSDGVNTYEAKDVLVLRDRGVVMETYSPVIN